MLSKELIQKLKQSNISKNAEKTKARVRAAWQTLNNFKKREVVDIAGIAKTAVYRIFKTGSVSAKLALPIAMAADVDPYYLIGATDESGRYSDELAIKLLGELGYTKLISGNDKKSRRSRIKNQSGDDSLNNQDVLTTEPDRALSEKDNTPPLPQPDAMDLGGKKADIPQDSGYNANKDDDKEISEDDMLLLLRAMFLRAKLNIGDAKDKAEKIKELLLS